MDALREQGWEPHPQWIPGHEGVYSNEQADELARQTADAPVDANASTEPVLWASQRQTLRSHANEQWKFSWEFNGHGALLRCSSVNPPVQLSVYITGSAGPPAQRWFRCRQGRSPSLVTLARSTPWRPPTAHVAEVDKTSATYYSIVPDKLKPGLSTCSLARKIVIGAYF